MSKYRHLNTIFIAIVIIISTTLLVGRLFDAHFAGGDGYRSHGVVTVDGEPFKRGEIISSGEDFAVVMINDEPIYLNTNTEIRLDDLRDETHITLIQGRIMTDMPITVHIRDTQIMNDRNNVIGVVHYSWLDQVNFVTGDGPVQLQLGNEQTPVIGSFSYTTLPPYNVTPVDDVAFDENHPDINFFHWVEGQINP
jgi:hypothetical protein